MKTRTTILFITAFAVIFFAANTTVPSAFAEMMIYPANGQDAEQQKKDEFECHQWAVGETGYDPTATQSVPKQESAQRGGALRGAAGGALVGLGIGAIAGNAGKGAAIGAGAGAVGGGVRQNQQNRQKEQATQQAVQQQQSQLDRYNKAKGVCLEGRGYKVAY